ncbi:MAG: 2-dehydro-3-deoxygalactonokinase [Alphaproteobacteria bacterium]
MSLNWIAVDWGTTNFRAWHLDADGAVCDTVSLAAGLNRISGQFEPVLLDAVGAWLAAGRATPVLISGMAGARQGWVEAPYLDLPADLDDLHNQLCPVPGTDPRVAVSIVPGLCQRSPENPDVMRGEEVQLLGLTSLLPDFSGPVCLPGTHAKWVRLNGNTVTGFTTHMTGELYALVSEQSILHHSIDTGSRPDTGGFAHGVATARQSGGVVLPHLFDIRAGDLLLDRSPAWNAGYLSGLLIAAEIVSELNHLPAGQTSSRSGHRNLAIIAAGGLADRYRTACDAMDITTRLIDGKDATLAGLGAIHAHLNQTL